MPLRLKSGGAWLAAPASGKLAVKSGGAWRVAATAKIKEGGVWRDSGYQGFPGDPSTPWVHAWSYYDLVVVWNEPTTGAPVASFQVQLLNEAGSVLQTQVPVVGGPNSTNRNDWAFRSLSPDTRYQVRVRTLGTNGLYSNWTAVLKVQMGHAEVHTPMSEYRTRPWYSYNYTGDVGQDGWIVCANAPNVTTWQMRIEVALANGSNPFCGTATRKAQLIINNAESFDVGYKTNPWTEDLSFGVSANAWQGIVLKGSGWWPPNGWAGHGYIHLWGNETYLYSWDQVTPAVPNSYW